MLTRAFSFFIAAPLFISACASVNTSSSEDQVVLSAVIQKLCATAGSGYSVLSTSTVAVDPSFVNDDLDRDAVRSLLNRNKTSGTLPPLDLCPKLKGASQSEIDVSMSARQPDGSTIGWPGFYKAFSGATGAMYLTLPGYSKRGDLAVVQVAGVCNDLCGGGSYWILRKIGGVWVLDKTVPGWVS